MIDVPAMRIHQDMFRFEKRRKGFTHRQIVGFAAGAAVAVCASALLWYVAELPYQLAGTVAFVLMLPCVLAGFVPVFGMPFEEAAARALAQMQRGPAIVSEGAHAPADDEGKGVSRAQKRSWKMKGADCGR